MKTETIDEGRLLDAAKNEPEKFRQVLALALEGEPLDNLVLSRVLLCWVRHTPASSILADLPHAIGAISDKNGVQFASNILARLDVALGFRKPSLGLYDHALHFIGGAQKYGCTIAYALQDIFDVTLIASKPVTQDRLQEWYSLDLKRCKMAVVPIPFFEERKQKMELIDPANVDLRGDNPFHLISRYSGQFDIFINNSMLEMVYPLANHSVFVCHFPERERSRFFYVDTYTEIIHNSLYTAEWIQKKWGLTPHLHIYPPVDMEDRKPGIEKENIILSVSRFDPGGNKQQLEMIKAFRSLHDRYPDSFKDWKLVLAGGSVEGNPYLEKIERWLSRHSTLNIELRVNVPEKELRTVYQRAKIFWHLCGLNQKDPAKVEHFGMNIVEAMQNACLPIVYKGGGQTEIVEDGVSGYLFSDETGLREKTAVLVNNPEDLDRMGRAAYERGKRFHVDIFVDKIRTHFLKRLEEYKFSFGF